MDLQPNKIDGISLPITNTRISASEWNQLVGSCMAFITEAGLTPDAEDNEQFLNAFKTIAAGLEIVGANTNLSNLTATGEARFTTKADTDLGNVSATGKATAIGWGMPDYDSGITIALATDGVTYTPSFPGVIRVYRANNDGQHYIRVYKGTSSSGIILQEYAGANQYNTGYCYAYIPVSAGETYFIICNTLSVVNAVFFPFKGAN